MGVSGVRKESVWRVGVAGVRIESGMGWGGGSWSENREWWGRGVGVAGVRIERGRKVGWGYQE